MNKTSLLFFVLAILFTIFIFLSLYLEEEQKKLIQKQKDINMVQIKITTPEK
jgi:hypothetical protein